MVNSVEELIMALDENFARELAISVAESKEYVLRKRE